MTITLIGKQYCKGSNDNGSYEYYKIFYSFVPPFSGVEGLMCESRNIYPSNPVFNDLKSIPVSKPYDLEFSVLGKTSFVSSIKPIYK